VFELQPELFVLANDPRRDNLPKRVLLKRTCTSARAHFIKCALVRGLDREEVPLKQEARLEVLRKLRGCTTCRSWADVIHLQHGDGELEEFWHQWEPHAGCCPKCGRTPRVFTVRFAY
jgi:hypothetical protein